MARPERHIKLNAKFLPCVVGLLGLLQLVVPHRAWFILLIGLGGALAIARLWAGTLAHGLSLVREVRFGWAQVGDVVEERFTLANDGYAPALWVELIDNSSLPGYASNWGTGIGSRQLVRWIRRGSCTRRGLFTVGPTQLATGDPLGLYSVTLKYAGSLPFLVVPPVVPLPSIQVSPGGKAGDGRPRPDAPDRSVSVSSVREYVPGDSLRWIHWRTTARRGSLFVRLFDGTPAADWWILLDLNEEVHVGGEENSTAEHAIVLAASLAHHGLESRRNVGLVAPGAELVWLEPRGGTNRRWDILRELAGVAPGQDTLASVLNLVEPSLGQHASLVVITPDVGGKWVEPLVSLTGRGVVPTVLLLDPTTFGGKDDPRGIVNLLVDLGVAHAVVTRGLLDRPEARPGVRGRWEWRVLGTGKAIPIRRPRDLSWRVLS
jgi:uncharacterized protein (DUF58 family)